VITPVALSRVARTAIRPDGGSGTGMPTHETTLLPSGLVRRARPPLGAMVKDHDRWLMAPPSHLPASFTSVPSCQFSSDASMRTSMLPDRFRAVALGVVARALGASSGSSRRCVPACTDTRIGVFRPMSR
jgi:hypothetical protein